jgi:hypothetical protein
MRDDERVQVPPDAILRTTGQLWKIVTAGLVLPLPTAVLAMWLLHRIGPDQSSTEAVGGTAVLVGATVTIALLFWSVRCPGCGVRWVRRVFADPDSTAAITRFLKMRSCPECAFGNTATANRSESVSQ